MMHQYSAVPVNEVPTGNKTADIFFLESHCAKIPWRITTVVANGEDDDFTE